MPPHDRQTLGHYLLARCPTPPCGRLRRKDEEDALRATFNQCGPSRCGCRGQRRPAVSPELAQTTGGVPAARDRVPGAQVLGDLTSACLGTRCSAGGVNRPRLATGLVRCSCSHLRPSLHGRGGRDPGSASSWGLALSGDCLRVPGLGNREPERDTLDRRSCEAVRGGQAAPLAPRAVTGAGPRERSRLAAPESLATSSRTRATRPGS